MTHNLRTFHHAGIFGLGVSGRGTLAYLQAIGCPHITLRSHDPLPPSVQARGMRIRTGEEAFDDWQEDILFLSPSMRRDRPQLQTAIRRGVVLSSDAEHFMSCVRGTVLGITGSDGKSTTTKITELLLNSGQFSSVHAGGNIGRALCPLLLDDNERAAYAVELSSFQLMYMTPRTARAVITNISENHLNWHTDMQEYMCAKAHIAAGTDAFVLNADDEAIPPLLTRAPFAVYATKQDERTLRSTGAQVCVTRTADAVLVNGHRRLSLSCMAMTGEHNVQNWMAAMALCEGLYDEAAAETIAAHFEGLPHRARCIQTVRGVRFVDASIDSSPARTITTLRAQPSPPILLLCGRGKRLSLDTLADAVATYAKAVVCAGEFGREVYEVLQGRLRCPLRYTPTMAEAVVEAAALATEGDTVLLSPAATSYDEFTNFEQRAEVFRHTVEALRG